jgi:lipopolysaccharide biosynthesis protein
MTMVRHPKVAVVYHIFYEDTIEHINAELNALATGGAIFFFNINIETPNQAEIKEHLLIHFPEAHITISSNKGKDIGGKLLLLKLCIDLGIEPEWFIFLHDKKSLQALNAKTWKNELFKIIKPDQLEHIAEIIKANPSCGIIATANYVRPTLIENGEFACNNASILNELTKKYSIYSNNYEYVAGTMFWAKAPVLLHFFKQHDPLSIRETLEAGNVIDNFDGTYTHSWERLLSWIITSQNLTIKTV